MPLVVGLDVGTQGARAVICDETGCIIAQAAQSFDEAVSVNGLPEGWFEQRPEMWWDCAGNVIGEAISLLHDAGFSSKDIIAVAADSTSGTIVAVDKSGEAIYPALMYSDTRSEKESVICNEASKLFTDKIGYKFNASFGLPKALWIKRHKPDIWNRAAKIIHASDYIVGKLTGNPGVSDNSNSLKTGYDLVDDCWPEFISDGLGIDIGKLPSVVSPGERIGCISSECAAATGLAEGTAVVGGVSDGTAGFIASGASEPGEWNSTLGTTLVMRGVSKDLVSDPLGRIYCHKHPDGYWLPGGASNVGGECLAVRFPEGNYDELNKALDSLLPTKLCVYPLVRRGERLPYVDKNVEGFVLGSVESHIHLYAAYLEGVAFVERWCFELMEELGAPVGNTIYTTGGGAKSLEWMRIRASVLKRCLIRPAITECAMGTAIVAASKTIYSSLVEASRMMVRRDAEIEPDDALSNLYEERYRVFRQECVKRGMGC